MSFEHKGIAISITASGEFTATVNGDFIVKPSLAAMKRHIDGKNVSKAFDAYYMLYGRLEKLRVTGTVRSRRSWGPQTLWKGEPCDAPKVVPSTPESDTLVAAIAELISMHREEKAALEKKQHAELESLYARYKKLEIAPPTTN